MTDAPSGDPRAETLERLVGALPYLRFLGIRFDRAGDELTAVLPFQPMLIGNPLIPAIHGGVTAAFLEVTAIVGLVWAGLESGSQPAPAAGPPGVGAAPATPAHLALPPQSLPKTIDITVDYLRPGHPRDSFARARINRQGRRYASVHVEAWQDSPDRLFAQCTGHFLMPDPLMPTP
ncbi:PaaI family thioesterase [Pseudogemmobacter sonorensis]|uniref:PaaI family thioesterase n=1 Tax=Pseudogemmobacter sonorensis TaxID=2989681 RepID=UPI0036B53743